MVGLMCLFNYRESFSLYSRVVRPSVIAAVRCEPVGREKLLARESVNSKVRFFEFFRLDHHVARSHFSHTTQQQPTTTPAHPTTTRSSTRRKSVDFPSMLELFPPRLQHRHYYINALLSTPAFILVLANLYRSGLRCQDQGLLISAVTGLAMPFGLTRLFERSELIGTSFSRLVRID